VCWKNKEEKRRKWTEKVPTVTRREIRKVKQLIDLKGLCHERNIFKDLKISECLNALELRKPFYVPVGEAELANASELVFNHSFCSWQPEKFILKFLFVFLKGLILKLLIETLLRLPNPAFITAQSF
jgi:hypothetical protein